MTKTKRMSIADVLNTHNVRVSMFDSEYEGSGWTLSDDVLDLELCRTKGSGPQYLSLNGVDPSTEFDVVVNPEEFRVRSVYMPEDLHLTFEKSGEKVAITIEDETEGDDGTAGLTVVLADLKAVVEKL